MKQTKIKCVHSEHTGDWQFQTAGSQYEEDVETDPRPESQRLASRPSEMKTEGQAQASDMGVATINTTVNLNWRHSDAKLILQTYIQMRSSCS